MRAQPGAQTTLVHAGWRLVVYAHTDRYGELCDLARDSDQLDNRWHYDRELRHAILLRLARAEMECAVTFPLRIASA